MSRPKYVSNCKKNKLRGYLTFHTHTHTQFRTGKGFRDEFYITKLRSMACKIHKNTVLSKNFEFIFHIVLFGSLSQANMGINRRHPEPSGYT